LLGWIGEHDEPGTHGRAKRPNRSTGFIYNHFQCVGTLVWLAEALGVPSETLLAVCAEVKKSGTNAARQCGVFRRAVPWSMIEERLLRLKKQESPLFAARVAQIKAVKPKPIGGYSRTNVPRK
jgi:hypothetical protein